MPRRRSLIVALLAVSAAGCGSSGTPGPDGGGPQLQAKAAAGTPALRVTATDGRVGDATRADSGGTTQLKVPTRIVDPAKLRLRAQRQGVGAGASCANAGLLPDAGNLATVADATLCLLNGERADAGLPPLASNERLARAALEHSQDMVSNQYFDHQAPDGRDVVDRVRSTGYIPTDRRWTVGENLAWGTGTLATPKSIVAAWMNSQGHRQNILRAEFREIGFGVVTGNPRSADGSGATYTTNFGAVSGGDAEAGRQVASTGTSAAAAARKAAAKRRAARRARAARRHRLAARARKARVAKARRARAARARRASRG
jgi:uncharacterized protein YkwD